MLTRSSQIGEFYIMSPPQVYPGTAGGCQFSCDVLIYDEESDRHVRIQWKDALEACLLNGAEENSPDKVDKAATIANNKDGLKVEAWKAAAERWSKFNKGSGDGTADSAAYSAATNPAVPEGGGDPEPALLDIDLRIVVARPFIEHLMHNAILTVAGRDTGATLFGPAGKPMQPTCFPTHTCTDTRTRAHTDLYRQSSDLPVFPPFADMQLSANTQVKTIEGCFHIQTFHACNVWHSIN